MATQNVNIGINVSDNGTAKKVVKNFKEIEAAAGNARRAAQGITTTVNGAPSGTTGSRAVAARAAPGSSQGQMSNEDYTRMRGTAGITGASGRDFAAQAQGLGGVVRLYATYAANVFAVGAAFRALSNAMDTTNLVKGLDQLGAASGNALGTLSKRLVTVTDGAISMRLAMESTAKAVSSGMSSENLLRMGKVGKQAAQALGIDMADAVDRLTRGITKLEPELLDELGIFTRVDIATQAYAKSVGKSTTAITDFERRMAFANAVLEEGERKFSAIDFETNPYTKLLATLKDVAQVGLEVINTFISPLIKFLSQNPKALTIAIGAIGISLLKQALPALGQFKAGLASAAAEATKLSTTRSADALKAQSQLNRILQAEQTKFLDSQDHMLDIAGETIKKAGLEGSKAAKLINTNMVGIDPEGVKQVEDQIKNVRIEGDKYLRQVREYTKAGENPVFIQQLRDKADAYYDTAFAAEKVLAGEVAAVDQSTRAVKVNTMAKLNANLAEKARVASIKQGIVATAAYNGSLIGVIGALKLANAELDKSGLKLGIFSKSVLLARAGVAAFGGMVSRVMSSLGGILSIITTVGVAVTFLSSFLSNNAKEMSDFGNGIENTDESLVNLGRTLDNINRKPFGEQFNTQSLMASATAINEITQSIGSLITKTLDADKAASGFDKFINSFKSLWGGDLRSQFAKSISGTVFGTLEKLGDSPEAKKARDSIASIIEVSPMSSRQDWQSAFKAIADNEPKLRLVEKAMKDLGMVTGITASKAEEFDSALKASEEAFKKFTGQFKASDPLAQLAESLIASGLKTAQAIEVPELAIARLASVVGDVNKIALFDEQDQQNLLKYGDSITKTNQEFEKNKQAVKASKEEIANLSKEMENLRDFKGFDLDIPLTDEEMSSNKAFAKAKKQLDERKEQLNKEQALLASTQLEITALTARFPNLAAGQLIKGADMLSTSISISLANGSAAFAEAVLSSVGDLPGLAKERERIEMLKLDSEARLIKIQTELARATMLNSAELRRASTVQSVKDAAANVVGAGAERKFESEKQLEQAQKTLDELDKSIAVIKVDPSQALAALKTIQSEIKLGNKVIQQDAAGLFEFVSGLAGLALQEQNNQTAKKVAAYKAIIDGVKEEFKQSAKVLSNQRETNTLLQANFTIQKARNGSLSEAESLELEAAQIQGIRLEREQKLLVISEKRAVLDKAQATKATGLADDVFQKERQLLLDQSINVVLESSNKITSSQLATSKDIYAEQQRLVAIETELVAIKKSGTDATQATADKIRDLNHETQKSLSTFTPEYQAQQDALLSITKARLQAERDEQALTSAFIERSLGLQKEAAQRLKEGQSPEKVESEIITNLNQEAEAYGKKVVAINSARDAEISALTQTEAARKKSSDFDDMLNSLKMLDSSWASFGTTLSDTVKAFADLTASQKQYTATIADLEKKRDAEKEGSRERLDLEDQISSTRKAAVKDEVSSLAKTTNATKKMFSEKTFAYKALEKIEKALHIFRLVSTAKEVAMDIYKTGVSVANSAIRIGKSVMEAGVDGVKAVVKAIASMPFPLNIAAGAATAAVVAGLLSQIGGKSPSGGGGSGGFVPTAEQRQETQGTAMGYDSQGQKVQVRRGVFGDTEAKSTAIANSLDRLQENSVVGLSYSDKMLTALKSIANSIDGAARGLYRIPGLVTGSISGTMEGTRGSSGFLGIGRSSRTTEIVDSGVQILGTMFDLFRKENADINLFETVRTTRSRSGFLGIGGGTSTSTNTVFENLEQENKRAYNQLLKALGSAGDLVYAMAEYAGVAENVVDTALQSLSVDELVSLRGLKGEEFINELRSIIGALVSDASFAILDAYEEFANFGEDLAETILRVQDSNKKVRQQLKNMMISDIQETLNLEGVIPAYRESVSKIASSITWAGGDQGHQDWKTLSNMGGMIGEGLRKAYAEALAKDSGASFTTLLQQNFSELPTIDLERLRAAGFNWASSVVTIVEDGITRSFDQADIMFESAKITEDLIKRAGSEEEYYEQSTFFIENFLTEAQRLVPVQKAVTDELARLAQAGFTSADGLIDTREEFALLVQGLDITTERGRETFQTLMDVQEGFIRITPAIKDMSLSAEEFGKKVRTLQMRILELTGTPEQLLAAQRAEILAETDDRLKSTQQYIFALEDVKTAEAALTNARQAEANKIKEQQKLTEGLVSNIKRYIDSLRKFKDSLLLSSASPLTPAERYEEARRQVTALYETAMGPATTPEEISARDAAMSQLEGSANAFLEASKVYNASSAQYTNDFNLVQEALTKSISTFSQQLTYEEKNLVALNSQISALETVNTSVLSVAEAIRNLDLAKAAVTAAAPARATITDTSILGRQGSATSISEARTYLQDYAENVERGTGGFTAAALYDTLQAWGVDSKSVGGLLGYSQQQVLDWFRNMDPSIPAFARGTNFVPEDMLAQIHKGERIIPAADNAQLMQNLNSRDEANRVLVSEIRNLRTEVQQLREQQAKETGDIIVANFDAQQRAAGQIETAMVNTAQQSNWTAKVRESVKLK